MYIKNNSLKIMLLHLILKIKLKQQCSLTTENIFTVNLQSILASKNSTALFKKRQKKEKRNLNIGGD